MPKALVELTYRLNWWYVLKEAGGSERVWWSNRFKVHQSRGDDCAIVPRSYHLPLIRLNRLWYTWGRVDLTLLRHRYLTSTVVWYHFEKLLDVCFRIGGVSDQVDAVVSPKKKKKPFSIIFRLRSLSYVVRISHKKNWKSSSASSYFFAFNLMHGWERDTSTHDVRVVSTNVQEPDFWEQR